MSNEIQVKIDTILEEVKILREKMDNITIKLPDHAARIENLEDFKKSATRLFIGTYILLIGNIITLFVMMVQGV